MKSSHPNKGRVLIITLTGDLHVPFVTKHLSSEFVEIDPFRILDNCELSFYHDKGKTVPIYDGQPIENIKSVWFRRPYMPERQDLKVPDDYKDYAYTGVRKHILDLYGMFQNAFWLSDYYTIWKAETKPRQLELAASIGFNTPKTLSTSSSKAAQLFLSNSGGSIAKSMATTLPIVNDRVLHFYTTKIHKGEEVDLSGLNVSPAIFQEAIDVDKGLRVTVVDNQVFTAAVSDKNHEDYPAILDWRRAYTDGKTHFERYDLPEKLQKYCINLTKSLNLRFGAIDLLLDKKGKYWFLEINPNGQWAFVEEDTYLPIGKSIATLLENAV